MATAYQYSWAFIVMNKLDLMGHIPYPIGYGLMRSDRKYIVMDEFTFEFMLGKLSEHPRFQGESVSMYIQRTKSLYSNRLNTPSIIYTNFSEEYNAKTYEKHKMQKVREAIRSEYDVEIVETVSRINNIERAKQRAEQIAKHYVIGNFK